MHQCVIFILLTIFLVVMLWAACPSGEANSSGTPVERFFIQSKLFNPRHNNSLYCPHYKVNTNKRYAFVSVCIFSEPHFYLVHMCALHLKRIHTVLWFSFWMFSRESRLAHNLSRRSIKCLWSHYQKNAYTGFIDHENVLYWHRIGLS